MKGAVAILLVLAIAHSAVELGQGAMTCEEIQSNLLPCLGFVTGTEPQPSDECCGGVKHLASTIVSTEDKRSACKCIKSVVATIPGIIDENVGALPGTCGAPLPFPISVDMDCDKIE